MATKFYNNQARVFHKLLNGADFTELQKIEIEKIDAVKYCCDDIQSQKYKDEEKSDLLEVKAFFDKIKFLEKPEIFSVNGWGYEETNYENLKVLGQVGGAMVCVLCKNRSDVYTIQKNKYTNKSDWAYLDSNKVRSTSWQKPRSNEANREQSLYNSYYGH